MWGVNRSRPRPGARRGPAGGRAVAVAAQGAEPVYGGSQRLWKGDARLGGHAHLLRGPGACTQLTRTQTPPQAWGPHAEERRAHGTNTRGKSERDSEEFLTGNEDTKAFTEGT